MFAGAFAASTSDEAVPVEKAQMPWEMMQMMQMMGMGGMGGGMGGYPWQMMYPQQQQEQQPQEFGIDYSRIICIKFTVINVEPFQASRAQIRATVDRFVVFKF